MDLGYTLNVIEKPMKCGNLVLDPKLYAKLIHPNNLRLATDEFNEGEK